MIHRPPAALVALVVLTPAGSALAKPPHFAANCPTGIVIEADRAGRAYLNGKPALVRSKNANYSEIVGGGVIVSVAREGGSLDVSYTGPHRAHGVCKVTEQEKVERPAPAARKVADDVSFIDKLACLHAVKLKTHNARAVVIDAVSSEANNTVTVGVGAQRAPWRCLVKRGRVADVMSQANEGAL